MLVFVSVCMLSEEFYGVNNSIQCEVNFYQLLRSRSFPTVWYEGVKPLQI